MRPTDIVTQVEEGRCHLGVTGMDVFAERAAEAEQPVVVVPDLGYGGCRLVVAVPESWIDVTHMIDLVDLTAEFKDAGKTFRVSTKYPALTQAYFRKWGIYYYQLIDSDGALELHPSLGIADIIVDLTSSGTTLKDNRLREIDEGTRARLGLLPDRPRAEPVGAGRRGRDRPAGPPARRDGRRPGLGGMAAPGSRRQPGRARPRDGRGRGRLSPRARGPAHLRGARSGTTAANPAGASPPWSPPRSSPPASASLFRARRRPGRRPPRPVRLRPRRPVDIRRPSRSSSRSDRRGTVESGLEPRSS